MRWCAVRQAGIQRATAAQNNNSSSTAAQHSVRHAGAFLFGLFGLARLAPLAPSLSSTTSREVAAVTTIQQTLCVGIEKLASAAVAVAVAFSTNTVDALRKSVRCEHSTCNGMDSVLILILVLDPSSLSSTSALTAALSRQLSILLLPRCCVSR